MTSSLIGCYATRFGLLREVLDAIAEARRLKLKIRAALRPRVLLCWEKQHIEVMFHLGPVLQSFRPKFRRFVCVSFKILLHLQNPFDNTFNCPIDVDSTF